PCEVEAGPAVAPRARGDSCRNAKGRDAPPPPAVFGDTKPDLGGIGRRSQCRRAPTRRRTHFIRAASRGGALVRIDSLVRPRARVAQAPRVQIARIARGANRIRHGWRSARANVRSMPERKCTNAMVIRVSPFPVRNSISYTIPREPAFPLQPVNSV